MDASQQRRLYLRASVKLLVALGFLFLLLPFVKSLPWPREEVPVDATLVDSSAIAPGSTCAFTLKDGSAVFVTRVSPGLREQLQNIPADRFWFPTAPGLLGQNWFVVRATSALDEPARFLPAQGDWPGGFVADSGAAWDTAGRALKPGPGHPSGYAMTVQNLMPMPWQATAQGIALIPLPPPAAPTGE